MFGCLTFTRFLCNQQAPLGRGQGWNREQFPPSDTSRRDVHMGARSGSHLLRGWPSAGLYSLPFIPNTMGSSGTSSKLPSWC